MTGSPSNINQLWAELIVEELVRNGVTHFALSPGSRSTPLTLAVAGNPAAHHTMHFDERGAAFFALGVAKATGRPAALVCTSGTAAANYYPAVIEAAMTGVPLLLLTADRPPELRGTGANQTIDQVKLYGTYPRWYAELPCPDRAVPAESILTLIDDACRRAMRLAGPVHINCPFREPLAPIASGDDFGADTRSIARWREQAGPYTAYAPATAVLSKEGTAALDAVVRQARRGLLVVGALAGAEETQTADRIARALGWPIAADVLSGIKGDAVDLLLLGPSAQATLAPDTVFHLGGPVTSKRVVEFLQRCAPRHYVHLSPQPARQDPAHRVTLRINADLASIAAWAAGLTQPKSDTDWADRFHALSARVAETVAAFCGNEPALSEIHVTRVVSRHLPAEHGLLLGNSMPIRDMDQFGVNRTTKVAGNRGASGIDGLVATAAGFAAGLNAPVTAVLGDLAVLHDLNSLALLRKGNPPVTIVAVNNDGGGIFSFLPIVQFPEHFEACFGTPHGLEFEHAARLFGIDYARPDTKEAFTDAYLAASTSAKPILIEVRTDRKENLALHARLHEAIRKAVEALL